MIESIHSDNVSQVRYNSFLSKPYKVNRGVREGGVLSPLLFLLFINDAESVFTSDARTAGFPKLGSVSVPCGLFADDVVVVGFSAEFIEYFTRKFYNYCLQKGLTMSLSKTVVMPVSSARITPSCQVDVGGVILPVVPSFKYLGVWFDTKGSDVFHSVKVQGKMRQAANLLIFILSKMGVNSLEKTVLFFKSLVFSQLYGTELLDKLTVDLEPVIRIFFRRYLSLPYGFPNEPLELTVQLGDMKCLVEAEIGFFAATLEISRPEAF